MTQLDDILLDLGARCVVASTREARQVTVDSRRAGSEVAFAAGPGATPASTHGHAYVAAAVKSGAPTVLVEDDGAVAVPAGVGVFVSSRVRALAAMASERLCGRPSTKLAVVGITGTNGKTTTSFVLAHLLEALGTRSAVFGTLGIGAPAAPAYTGFTTPEADVISARLAALVEDGTEAVAMEVSSHALALERAEGVHFAVAAFTNLSHDHLDFHESIESYRAAKERLFRDLLPPGGVAVVPVEDDGVRAAAGGHRCLTWGPGGDVSATAVTPTPGGTRLRLALGDVTGEVEVSLFGAYNVENLLVACACALALGHAPAAVLAAVPGVRGAPGRFERVGTGTPVVVVDFAHTPDALAGAARTARGLVGPGGKLWVVFGCGGDRDAKKRPVMGRVAAELADVVIVTDDNPRTEDAQAIRAAVVAGAAGPGRVHDQGDRRRAIEQAVAGAGHADVVLIAGKGHETTQTRGQRTVPFDDRVVSAEALAARGDA